MHAVAQLDAGPGLRQSGLDLGLDVPLSVAGR